MAHTDSAPSAGEALSSPNKPVEATLIGTLVHLWPYIWPSDRADLKTIRTAIDRLKRGRIVGLFPEGGIRDGARSLLEGAPLRPGAATLAQIARMVSCGTTH